MGAGVSAIGLSFSELKQHIASILFLFSMFVCCLLRSRYVVAAGCQGSSTHGPSCTSGMYLAGWRGSDWGLFVFASGRLSAECVAGLLLTD